MEIKKLPKVKFPKALLEIPQPPEDLWIIGDLPDEDLIHLCIVGSRKFTSYGREVCEKIIAGLKGYPIVIVSGLAMGIDAIAHKKALTVGLKTLVFPGSGLSPSAMYPKTNAKLAEEIFKSGGCLISEFESNFKATLWSFGRRNRLMAGISKATLIIEAEEKSGTLITARLTTEYNRDLLVVPGSIFSPNSKGTNRLLHQGATPVTCAEDVLEALGFEKEKDEEKQAKLFLDLSPEEKIVVNLLREPMQRDYLIRAMKLPIPTANAVLSVMEIKELIKEEMGEIRLI
ncbi:DNA protecting protein DprA [Candidatus Nomurabacteria bacterium RIFCSPHIGHO2_02_FULL_37_13]|uniref:DNA protecting protein DprA n=1 Tax=Candidatus Nomurabacteria bacterium RIFCSPHIGHO2_02_FULL_37_13 TaxID=1801750 RepID=A0A1F6W6V2_9BACT|nr:MAG: DNA protecting protein DprA [Candidatus Nomurabacteria bacterium RIFCSPHIGHO2_01_FULL_36_23]OGI77633.1 MAG: DNA protecting protein DprA [Candidatus Nomurabacteria bacterium RIFCSPHIGHO2_02_FULL_37_13]OGI88277.1 MAG: DNA protecting protein DprA [Candidatus Nomurabacteria bacterium RIFCSPLOWO2_01_FULL_37_25]